MSIKLVLGENYYTREDGSLEFNQVLPEVFVGEVDKTFAELALKSSLGNRNLVKSNILNLINSIDQGDYVPGNDAMAFSINGNCGNGHHRMNSLLQSSKETIEVLMRIKVPLNEFVSMDTGQKRSAAASGYFSQVKITEGQTAILKAFLGGGYTTTTEGYDVSNSAILKQFQDYKVNIERVQQDYFESKNIKGVTTALILGVWTRADISGADQNKLRRFAKILMDGVSMDGQPGDKSIIKLSDGLRNSHFNKKSGWGTRKSIFNTASVLLQAALNGVDILNYSKNIKEDIRNAENVFAIPQPIMLKKSLTSKKKLHDALTTVASQLQDQQTITPLEVAQEILKLQPVDKKDPAKYLARILSATMKNYGEISLENGKFVPVRTKVKKHGGKRIASYKWLSYAFAND